MDLNSIMAGVGQWLQSAVGGILTWTTYVLEGLVLLAFFWGVYMVLQYKYKIIYDEVRMNVSTVPDAEGNPKLDAQLGDSVSLTTKSKKDYARAIRVKGVDKWRLLWARKDMPPVPFKFIEAGNKVHMIRTAANAFIPCMYQKQFVVGNHTVESYMPMPVDIKFWEQQELKQAALETLKEGYHKQLLIIAGVVIFVILVWSGIMIYFNLSMAQKSVEHIDILSNAVQNLAGGIK